MSFILTVTVFFFLFPPYSRSVAKQEIMGVMPDPAMEGSAAHVILEYNNNYGSAFGVYVASGYLKMASYIAEQSCFSGDELEVPATIPARGAAVNYVCE